MIEVNKIYKYPELCEAFGEHIEAGNSKTAQVKRWQQQYLIEKIGTKYKVIRELTDRDRQYIKEVNSFSDYLQNWVLSLICEEQELVPEQSEYILTYRQLIEYSPLVNRFYYSAKNDIFNNYKFDFERDKQLTGIETNIYRKRWFSVVEKMNKELVDYALTCLQGRGLILYMPYFVFYKRTYNEKGTLQIVTTVPDKEEVEKFMKYRLDAVKELGYTDLKDIFRFSADEHSAFDIKINNYLKENGYHSYSNAAKIIVAKDLYKDVGNYMININVNEEQQTRLLNSKRFKRIAPMVHKEMVRKLIDADYYGF